MLKALKHLTLTTSLLAAGTAGLHAQIFVTPNAVEYTFGDPKVRPAENTSCYSLSSTYTLFPYLTSVLGSSPHADLYVAGWNSADVMNGKHEVTVLLTQTADPTNVLWKASISYDKVRDLEVGSIYNNVTNSTNILVAYYKEGIGHFLDMYDLTTSSTDPCQLVGQIPLSSSPTYGRIRMDGHAVYDCAIAWVNTTPGPTKGIQTMVRTNNTWSAVSTLSGTANKTGVDIALTLVTEPVNFSAIAYPLHFVYSGGGFITEASVDMSALSTATPGMVLPHENDSKYVGGFGLNSRLVLDCADFSVAATPVDGSSWAYVYTDGMQVIMRNRNATMAAVNESIVTSGMLGNSPLDPAGVGYQLSSPAVNYGWNPTSAGAPEQIMVTWYTTDGAALNGYMGVQTNANGNAITCLPDYLLLPNASTPHAIPNFTSGVALSKTGPKGVGYFLYATYYDIDPNTGDYQLHHAFHKWGDVAFKGNGDNGLPVVAAQEATTFSAYPNPFLEVLHTSVSLQEAGMVQLQLLDMAGRLVWEHKASLTKGHHELNTGDLKKLTAGTYMLTVALNGKRIDTKMIAKQ